MVVLIESDLLCNESLEMSHNYPQYMPFADQNESGRRSGLNYQNKDLSFGSRFYQQRCLSPQAC